MTENTDTAHLDDTSQHSEGLRERVRKALESTTWEIIITALIVVNGIILGFTTSKTAMAKSGELITMADNFILGIFVVEILTRIWAYGLKFWRDPWSIFDFAVVGISLVPATGNLSILRSFRILRILRLISTIKSMRNVVSGLLRALPGMGSIIMLLVLILYVFSVMATQLYGEKFPDFFGTIGASAFTLFQVMTLEGWPDLSRPVIEAFPWAWAFFVIFILVSSFTILNLFIGIIVEAMQSEHDADIKADKAWTEKEFDQVIEEIQSLRAEIRALKTSKTGSENE